MAQARGGLLCIALMSLWRARKTIQNGPALWGFGAGFCGLWLWSVAAGLPPFSPHRVRDTVAELAKDHCSTPEDYKAWSQNMGHDDVMTTFSSYGSVSPGRQVELMGRFRRRGPLPDEDAVIDE